MEEKTELLVAADRLEELGFETAAAALRKLANQKRHFYWLAQKTGGTYDQVRDVVVRASSAKRARQLASIVAMDEGTSFWLDPKRSRCMRLSVDGPDQVICRDALEA